MLTPKATYEITAKDKTKKAMRSAKAGMDRLKKSAFKLKAALIGGGALVGGLILVTRRTITWADSIGKAALQVRLTTDEVQKLTFAGARQGLNQQEVIKGLGVWDKRLSKLRANFGPLNALLKTNDKELLKSLKNTTNNSEALTVFIKRLDKVAPNLKAAYIDAAFSGTKFNKLLLGGSVNLKILTDQALKSGNVLKNSLVVQSEAANDRIDIMTGSLKVMSAEIVLKLLPAFEKFTNGVKKNKEAIAKVGSAIVTVVATMGRILKFAVNNPVISSIGLVGFVLLGKKGKAAVLAMSAIISKLTKLFSNVDLGKAQLRSKLEIKTLNLLHIAKNKVADLDEKRLDIATKFTQLGEAEFKKQTIKVQNEIIKQKEKILKLEKDLQQASALGRTLNAAKKLNIDPVLAPKTDSTSVSNTANQKKEQLNLQLTNLKQSLLSEQQVVLADLAAKKLIIQTSFDEGLIKGVERKQLILDLEKNHQLKLTAISEQGATERARFEKKSIVGKAKFIAGFLSDQLSKGAAYNKTVFKANKIAGIANAAISTYEGAAAALKWGFPLGPIFAAAIVASGFAQIKGIRSQTFGGGASSASLPSVGGGTSPGQQVAELGVSSRASATQQNQPTFDVNLGDDEDLVSVGAVRRMMDKISAQVRDGYQFNVA